MKDSLYFSLDEYFCNTNKYYYFFDGMFKYKDILKKEGLIDLHIPSSTYRLNRETAILKNDNHIKLLKYFSVNELDINNKGKYELLLTKIENAIYYKNNEKLTTLEEQLDNAIEDNNFLKPIFILFKLFIGANKPNLYYKKYLDVYHEEIKYILDFPRQYFSQYYNELLNILLLIIDPKQVDERYYCSNEHLTWLFHAVKGSECYAKEDYKGAILYYQSALNDYFNDGNFTRYISTKNNISAMYNLLGLPSLALEEIMPALNFSLSIGDCCDKMPIKFVVVHYLMALLLLKKYDSIINFYKIYDDNSWYSKICLVIILYCMHKNNCIQDNIINAHEFSVDEDCILYKKVILEGYKLTNEEIFKINKSKYNEFLLRELSQID